MRITMITILLSTTLAMPARAEPPPAVVVDAASSETEHDDRKAQAQRGRALLRAGLGVSIAGGATLLTVTLPAHLLEQRALDDAQHAPTLAAQRETLERAYRRNLAMQISAGVGLSLMLVGATLAITGSVMRARGTDPDRRVQVAPSLGGAVLTGRF